MRAIKVNNVLIIFILSIIIFICVYSLVSNKDYQIINYQNKIDSLNKVNTQLYKDIGFYKDSIENYEQSISYLGQSKESVIIKYKTKINEIENFNCGNVLSEFDGIFSKVAIK